MRAIKSRDWTDQTHIPAKRRTRDPNVPAWGRNLLTLELELLATADTPPPPPPLQLSRCRTTQRQARFSNYSTADLSILSSTHGATATMSRIVSHLVLLPDQVDRVRVCRLQGSAGIRCPPCGTLLRKRRPTLWPHNNSPLPMRGGMNASACRAPPFEAPT